VQHNKGGEQNLFKLFGHFSVLIFLFSISLSAGSFEKFQTTQAKKYVQYQDESDAAFNSYLKKQWNEYTSQEPKSLYKKLKPENLAPTIETHTKPLGPQAHVLVKKYSVKKIVPQEIKENAVKIEFFGATLGFSNLQSIKSAKFYPLNQEGISVFFGLLAASQYEQLVKEIRETKKHFSLNDWGVYLLIDKLSKKYYTGLDEAKLLTWFLFSKLGYDVKIGLSSKHIVLMFYSEKNIYNTPYYKFGVKKFYVLNEYAKKTKGRVYTYKRTYPNATKAFNLELQTLPILAKNIKKKTLSFRENGETFRCSFRYNQNLINFMKTYPQADYATYFNTQLENETYNDIAQDLKKFIDGKKMSVALNFVLHFVQKSFQYQVDEKQFGREKVMFSQETLYYDKSDCEDRAILFAYLVKKLFHIRVVGVKYKDHMTTALYVPMKGDSIKKGSRKYIIADPTYVNANIGLSMKKYKNVKPENLIVIR